MNNFAKRTWIKANQFSNLTVLYHIQRFLFDSQG